MQILLTGTKYTYQELWKMYTLETQYHPNH